eukprot:359983-Chlamydomonas_euryale.AAC.3
MPSWVSCFLAASTGSACRSFCFRRCACGWPLSGTPARCNAACGAPGWPSCADWMAAAGSSLSLPSTPPWFAAGGPPRFSLPERPPCSPVAACGKTHGRAPMERWCAHAAGAAARHDGKPPAVAAAAAAAAAAVEAQRLVPLAAARMHVHAPAAAAAVEAQLLAPLAVARMHVHTPAAAAAAAARQQPPPAVPLAAAPAAAAAPARQPAPSRAGTTPAEPWSRSCSRARRPRRRLQPHAAGPRRMRPHAA